MSLKERNNAFGKFINDLLATHEFNDKLRDVVTGNDSLMNSVQQILFETQLEAFFIEVDEISDEVYIPTIKKLKSLRESIKNKVPTDWKQYNILELIIIKYSERRVRLSKEILLYLNELNDSI